MGMMVMTSGEDVAAEETEMVASRHPQAGAIDAYERVLGSAMEGDVTMFAREDYVEEAWRIVDSVLKAGTPVYEYEPKTWGPSEAERLIPKGGWSNPSIEEQTVAAAA
jgi:glucose-6-phosphate 1-dehydrogenase